MILDESMILVKNQNRFTFQVIHYKHVYKFKYNSLCYVNATYTICSTKKYFYFMNGFG